jgi:hypothetical protein
MSLGGIRRLFLVVVLLLPSLAFAQGGTSTPVISSPEPLPNCAGPALGQPTYIISDLTAGILKWCSALNTWTAFGNGSGTIGGSVAVNQIAVGTGPNTIGGTADALILGANLRLGHAGSTNGAGIVLFGRTSGSVSINVDDVTGSPALILPSGTLANGILQTDGGNPQHLSWAAGPVKICSQVAVVMPTGAISSATLSSAVTGTCTGLNPGTDTISCSSPTEIFSITGFTPTTNGVLSISTWMTTNTIHAEYENNTTGTITPGALTLNCAALR